MLYCAPDDRRDDFVRNFTDEIEVVLRAKVENHAVCDKQWSDANRSVRLRDNDEHQLSATKKLPPIALPLPGKVDCIRVTATE
jgi:hypothetical protein